LLRVSSIGNHYRHAERNDHSNSAHDGSPVWARGDGVRAGLGLLVSIIFI